MPNDEKYKLYKTAYHTKWKTYVGILDVKRNDTNDLIIKIRPAYSTDEMWVLHSDLEAYCL